MEFFDTKECEWSDQEVQINGKKIVKIRGFKVKKAKEKEHLYASGSKAIDIQGGNEKVDGTLTILRGALVDLNREARAVGGNDITDIRVTLVSIFRAKGNRLLETKTVIGVEITEFEEGMMQGDKFQEVSLPYLALDVVTT